MLFDISSLPQGGATLETPVAVASFEWEGGSQVTCRDFQLRGRFQPTRVGWSFEAEFSGCVGIECTRCLTVFGKELSATFRLLIVPGRTEGHDVPSFESLEEGDPEAVDLFELEGKLLDLESVLREQIDLALPYRVLCRTDCRGLCETCGANLNLGVCGCGAPVEARWSELAALRRKLDTKRGDDDPGRK